MHQQRDLSLQLLTHVAELLEESQRKGGGCNYLAARFAGHAARLLEFDALSLRFANLLAALTPDQYWSAMITNIPRTDDVLRGVRQLLPLAEIEREHPLFTDDYATTMITDSSVHLLPCLDHHYEAAFAAAESEASREEVALTQAVLGDTELAIASTSRLSEHHRRDNVLFVVAIELYRHNRSAEAEAIHKRLPKATLCEWGSAHMALGVANRVPWAGYPYADY